MYEAYDFLQSSRLAWVAGVGWAVLWPWRHFSQYYQQAHIWYEERERAQNNKNMPLDIIISFVDRK